MSSRDYFSLFLSEGRTLWQEAAEQLARTAPDAELLMRIAHTLKGMAATMGYADLTERLHAFEEQIGNAPDRAILEPAWADIGASLDRAASLGHDRELRAATAGEPDAVTADPGASTPLEPGQWVELVPEPTDPMPRARLLQWHRQLSSWGAREIWPEPVRIRSEDSPRVLRVRLDAEWVERLARLPRLQAIRAAAPPAQQRDPAATALKVDLAAFDTLFTELGELHNQVRILRAAQPGGADWERSLRNVQGLVARTLHRASSTRLSSLEPLIDVYARAARDAAERMQRQITLERSGERLRIARETVERLLPLMPHLARNAVAHGLGSAEARQQQGKPKAGQLRIRATQQGAAVRLHIEDDGPGVDEPHLDRLAQRHGLDPARLSREQKMALLFAGNASRRSEADTVSGRGVGLDAVREAIEAAGGEIRAHSEPGQGFRLELEIPVPLSLQPMLELQLGDAVIGLLEPGWTVLEKAPAPADEADHLHFPGLPRQGSVWLRDPAGRLLQADAAHPLGNVYLHAVRTPLADEAAVVGFYLDPRGFPRLVLNPLPLDQPVGASAWTAAERALQTILPRMAKLAPLRNFPDVSRGWQAWSLTWPDLGRVVLAVRTEDPDTLPLWFDFAPEDPVDAVQEKINWIFTRALEGTEIDHHTLIAGGPPQACDLENLERGRITAFCGFGNTREPAAVLLWLEGIAACG